MRVFASIELMDNCIFRTGDGVLLYKINHVGNWFINLGIFGKLLKVTVAFVGRNSLSKIPPIE